MQKLTAVQHSKYSTTEGPMTPVIEPFEFISGDNEPAAPSSGTYTPGGASPGEYYPGTPDASERYSAFPNDPNSFHRIDDAPTNPKSRRRNITRRCMRRLKQAPFVLKLLLLLGALGVIGLLAIAGRGLRLGALGGPAWADIQNRLVNRMGPREFCDPTQGNGFVNEENVWERTDGACSSSHLLYRFRHTPKERYRDEFPEFVNKTVFVFGDSIGRHFFDDYCKFLTMHHEKRPFPGQEEPVFYWEGALCTEPTLNFKVIHFHSYGFANTSESNVESMAIVRRAFPGGPWDFETRISRLFNEAMPDLQPDFIQINGGTWDFLWMYNRDIKFKQHNDLIPQADLQTFQQRLRELVVFVREMFPAAKPLWINSHWLNPDDLKIRHRWSGPFFHKAPLNQSEDSPLLPPLFTPRRQSQHRHALYLAAEETGVDMIDYWKLKDSFMTDEYFTEGDWVHPQEGPRAVMIDMLLEKMHRWFAYGI